MMNKKAVELSINFVVMLIIAIVVFGMGIVLFTKFFQQAEDIKTNLDEQTRKELESKMMSSSEEVIVYPTSLTIRKGKADVIGVGILNIRGNEVFTLESEYQACYDRDGELESNCGPSATPDQPLGLLQEPRTINVAMNKREIASVPIKVLSGSASAKYSVLITVRYDGETEPVSTNLVYINVP